MDSSPRKGGLVSISPSHTPRCADKQGNGNSNTKRHDREKGVNVQVLLRCRPLSEDEMRMNTPVVISCNEYRREVSAFLSIANKQIDKTFTFDKVFGPKSKQRELYDQAITPIVNEVLDGYNCTIFAYGQTGTGKTYTMEGGRRTKNGEFPSDAGVIPRAVKQIFEMLESQDTDYSMKVTFLELYNEELTDLLAPEESKLQDDKSKKPIALMEDGKGGVFVRGLEEEIVSSASEIYKILDMGSSKRRTAETLLNKQSSRSHSIFSITIHIKECTPEGEEMIKCGKLNLVDLAGSENIMRSGAKEGRAREAGEINKSLLTLGRVINALVEHSGHIPYRESKLTRLLRDSLGGKTKTCIIATIAPSIHCLEETLSTLDYAHRAKSIKNKPEVNQKMVKSAMIKDLCTEIDRLKQEVHAAREKNGVYIPVERFLQDEAEKKAMTEKIEQLETDLESKNTKFDNLEELYDSQQQLNVELSKKLEKTQRKLEDTEHTVCDLERKNKQAKCTIKEKEYLIANLLNSEKALADRAYELRSELQTAAADMSSLFSKIERKDKVADSNGILVQRFQSQLTGQLDILHGTVSTSIMQQEKQLKGMEEYVEAFISKKVESAEDLRMRVSKLKGLYGSGIITLEEFAGELDTSSQTTIQKLKSHVMIHSSALEDCLKGMVLEADKLLVELQSSISKQGDELVTLAQQQREAHLRAVEATRSIANISYGFLKTIDVQVSKMSSILEESQAEQNEKFVDLEKKFEECAANEERQLLEKVAELLVSSTARKQLLVQNSVNSLRENAASRSKDLHKELSVARRHTHSFKDQWGVYIKETENHYLNNTAAVETARGCLHEGLQQCIEKAQQSSQQWKDAQGSLLRIEEENLASVDHIVKRGMETNQLLHERFSSAALTSLQEVDVEHKGLIFSIDNTLKLDKDLHENFDSMINGHHGGIKEFRDSHKQKIVEMTQNANKCLEDDYEVDQPTCSTPRRRSINLPSLASIEELKTPAFEELIKSFWESSSAPKQANGDLKHSLEVNVYQSQVCRDSRLPLTPLNYA